MQCDLCKSEWKNTNGNILTNCPFCKVLIQPLYNQTKEDIMLLIAEKFSNELDELYESPIDFDAVIDEYFPDDRTGDLLKILISNNASTQILKLKNLSCEEQQIEYENLIKYLQYKTFILAETLTPALDLLCFGLGVIPSSPLKDFVIENGVLKEYLASEKNIVIPNIITSIGPGAFADCINLTKVIIPNSVSIIKRYAFSDCINLEHITIPNSISVIEADVFKGCNNLNKSTKEQIRAINNNVFYS